MPDPLSAIDRRVLGVLVEKGLTSAAPEPLTLNAIVTGSNQKSNRDPVMTVEEPEVDSCLEGLQQKGLVFRITGGRVDRWRHNLYDAWQVSKPELALLAELLLRGPQTAAEARSRASRMEPLDHDAAATAIRNLVERQFVVWLAPESRRGAKLTHGFHTEEELQRHRSGAPAAAADHDRPPTSASSPSAAAQIESRLNEALSEIASLRTQVQELRAIVGKLPGGSRQASTADSLGAPVTTEEGERLTG
jgi:uncharacterized protein